MDGVNAILSLVNPSVSLSGNIGFCGDFKMAGNMHMPSASVRSQRHVQL